MDYPITMSNEWERHTTVTITNSSGKYTEGQNLYYECTGTIDVNTKAGLFSCYIVKHGVSKITTLMNYDIHHLK